MSAVEIPEWAASKLAYTASSEAEFLSDPRYNGQAWAATRSSLENDPTIWAKWEADRPAQLARQKEWRQLAHTLDPDYYDENGKHRG